MKKRYMMNTFWIIYLLICVVCLVCLCVHRRNNNQQNNIFVVDEEQPEAPAREKEDLQYTLETVNSWLNNCDQKAGMLLAVLGVAITVLVTSDFMKELRTYIFGPFVEYWTTDSQLDFSFGRFTVFCLLVTANGMLMTSCYYLFKAITANTDYGKMRQNNPRIVGKSYLFFGSISGMTYDEFRSDRVDFKEDLKSQIYTNSKIAVAKFRNYNKGLFWFKMILVVSVMLFVAVLLVK